MFEEVEPEMTRISLRSKTDKINVHLTYEPVGARPLLGETKNPHLTAIEQAVRPFQQCPKFDGSPDRELTALKEQARVSQQSVKDPWIALGEPVAVCADGTLP